MNAAMQGTLRALPKADVLFLGAARRSGRGRNTSGAARPHRRAIHRQRPPGERAGDGQGSVQAPLPAPPACRPLTGSWRPATSSEVRSGAWLSGDREAVEAGSTVGLSASSRTPEQLQPAIDEAFELDDEVMVEQFIAGRELTVVFSATRRCRLAKSSRSTRFTTTNASTRREWRSKNFPAKLTDGGNGDGAGA